jgi:beta-barrel assembly-enhancing protease
MNSKNSAAISRRQFLYLSSLTAAGWLVGCATNPVTGENQFMLVSENQEIKMDQQHSPHQFSADYGTVQDSRLNAYVSETSHKLAALTHRPQMPYSFRVVNANYVNAYAFPGGSIAATRGIMLKMRNEGELAALMGHELGHVNARHTAEIMSKSQITNLLVVGLAAYAGSKSDYGDIAAQLGMLSSGVLLASYSRDNERQADALGMEYMVKAGYGPDGMVGLMNILNDLSKGKHSAAQLLFSTHPMSSERYSTAVNTARTQYAGAKRNPLYSERYMDNIAGLRRIRGAIENMQKGEAAMGKKKYEDAQGLFDKALKQAPRDYAGLVLMAKCQLAQKKTDAAERYLKTARQVYPKEGQALYLDGYVKLKKEKYDTALMRFTGYDKLLPGNPNITFFKGVAYEGKGVRESAADSYNKYLQAVKQGENAKYAYGRLVEWGYIKKK